MLYKHLISADGDVFSSNLPDECTRCMYECHHISQAQKCPIDQAKKRTGTMLGKQGGVFLCTDNDVKSSAKFKGTLSVYFDVLSEILGIKDAQAEKKAIHLRRLTHNLISYNAHILQDLYSIVPQDRLAGNGQEQVGAFSDAIRARPKDAAVSLLRILKNTNLSKSEFSIFEKLYDEDPTLEVYSHKIHKVILLVFNSFWYDFIQKRVRINISRCDKKLNLDYESVSAAFAHIIDNAVKYTATGTELEISFEEKGGAYIVKFDMVSMKIDQDEKYLIFNEGYSGRHPVRADLSGKGIGLGIVRKLLALNNATVSIQSDEGSSEIDLDGFPYKRTLVTVTFNDYQSTEVNSPNITTGFSGRSLRSRR